MKYRIMQIREAAMRDHAFRPLPKEPIDPSVYRQTYAGEMACDDDATALLALWRMFNMDHPKDFHSYSLSMADVVVLGDGETTRAYYCDTARWAPLGPGTFPG